MLHRIFDLRENVFLTGPGGSGKTAAMKRVYEIARKRWGTNSTHLTATTGIASTHLPDGITLHSYMGSRIWTKNEDQLKQELEESPRRYRSGTRFLQTKLLIVDEISMLGKSLLQKFDILARFYLNNSKPLGGMQVLFVGDFFQLPPVMDRLCFESPVWTKLNLHMIELTHSHRHDGCVVFSNLLKRIRQGHLLPRDVELLNTRLLTHPDRKEQLEQEPMEPIALHCCHRETDQINQAKYAALESRHPEGRFQADDALMVLCEEDKKFVFREYTGNATVNDVLTRIPLLQRKAMDVVSIKHGAQYVLTYNVDQRSGLVNGRRFVTQWNDDRGHYDLVFEHGVVTYLSDIKVKFYQRIPNEVDDLNRPVYLHRDQYAMRLGYALTIHSAQGMTVKAGVLNIGNNVFSASQSYVALSRVENLDGLYLEAFEPSKIMARTEVKDFYQRSRKEAIERMKEERKNKQGTKRPHIDVIDLCDDDEPLAKRVKNK